MQARRYSDLIMLAICLYEKTLTLCGWADQNTPMRLICPGGLLTAAPELALGQQEGGGQAGAQEAAGALGF